MSTALPAKASLSQLRTQAKDLRKAVAKNRPDALDRIRKHYDGDPAAFTLRDAQLAIAREYGIPSWSELMQKVATEVVEGRELHRYFGVELNNETWDLMEQIGPDSPLADRERLLYGAYASTLHWLEAGNEANHARGEYLIARAALHVGRTDVGLHHARRCLELVENHPDQMEDWDAPCAHEVMARALAANSQTEQARQHLARLEQLSAAIADPKDRKVLEDSWSQEPWFGLR